MKLFFYSVIIFIFISNCTLNKVIDHHGVHSLIKKEKKLILDKSNSNDIFKLLGPPSTKSHFDNDLWIYIERKTTNTAITSLGKKKILANNVLIVEINSMGMLVKKTLFTKNDLKNQNFEKNITGSDLTKTNFIYSFLGSMRQKVNDPLGKKRRRVSEN